MKQHILTTAAVVLVSIFTGFTASAQRNTSSGPVGPMRVGAVTLNLGLGIGADYKGDYYNSPFGVKGAVEWGLWHAGPGTITLGGEMGSSFSNGGYYDGYRNSTFVVAIRSAWHYGWKVRGLDTYAGLSAGLGFHHYYYKNNRDYSDNQVIPAPGIFIGASYFVAPRFGFNIEMGHDITAFQGGVIFKLR